MALPLVKESWKHQMDGKFLGERVFVPVDSQEGAIIAFWRVDGTDTTVATIAFAPNDSGDQMFKDIRVGSDEWNSLVGCGRA